MFIKIIYQLSDSGIFENVFGVKQKKSKSEAMFLI